MVLSQALASGLPVICTDGTGGPDLARTPTLTARITVVPSGDADALASAIEAWRDRFQTGEIPPALSESERESLSWAAYAQRHADELMNDRAAIANIMVPITTDASTL
jgi:glycosyltransferase involved in cell wall biosynthesis